MERSPDPVARPAAGRIVRAWPQAPRIGFPRIRSQLPCTVVRGNSLWLAYLVDRDGGIAVVEFAGHVEHRASRAGSYAVHGMAPAAALPANTFSELQDSPAVHGWRHLPARHWVVTFPDRTLDIVAKSACLARAPVAGSCTFAAALAAMARFETQAAALPA